MPLDTVTTLGPPTYSTSTECRVASLPPYTDPRKAAALPVYSITAQRSEYSFMPDIDSPRVGSSVGYSSEHMKIDLHRTLSTLSSPAYGLGGIVEGSVSIKGGSAHVLKVKVTLEGRMTVATVADWGAVTAQSHSTILSKSLTLYDEDDPTLSWSTAFPFRLPFPDRCTIGARSFALPLSYRVKADGGSSAVVYSLRFDLFRKGLLRRHESKSIPILYLPKSRPPVVPLSEIPTNSRLAGTPFGQGNANIKVLTLSRLVAPNDPKDTRYPDAVYLAVPTNPWFTSGDTMPFLLSLVWPADLVDVPTPHFRCGIIKRIRVFPPESHEAQMVAEMDEVVADHAEVRRISGTTRSVQKYSGAIQVGEAGREGSWSVAGVVEVTYFFRASLYPASGTSLTNMPRYHHEEPVWIATDPYGTLEFELARTGGMPAPALGLAPA